MEEDRHGVSLGPKFGERTLDKKEPMAKSKGQQLKELIDARDGLVMIGVFDGFSARLVERMGYQSALVSGAGLSESRLGRPDVGIMDLTENVAGVKAIAACTDLC